jgi:hypothetical protein
MTTLSPSTVKFLTPEHEASLVALVWAYIISREGFPTDRAKPDRENALKKVLITIQADARMNEQFIVRRYGEEFVEKVVKLTNDQLRIFSQSIILHFSCNTEPRC